MCLKGIMLNTYRLRNKKKIVCIVAVPVPCVFRSQPLRMLDQSSE